MFKKDEWMIKFLTSSITKGSFNKWMKYFNLDESQEQAFETLLNELVSLYILYVDEHQNYHVINRSDYMSGMLSIHEKGFGFVDGKEEHLFIPANEIKMNLNKDEVIAKKNMQRDGQIDGMIVKTIAHQLRRLVGTIKKDDNVFEFIPDQFLHYRKINITNYDEFSLVADHKVSVIIDTYEEILTGHIEKILGYKYDPGVDIVSVLYEHGVDPEFSKSSLAEVEMVPKSLIQQDYENRRDLRNEMIITIDGEDARDLDDAISIHKTKVGYKLGVHIADVSYYVKKDTQIDKEAYRRGTSVYVVDRVVPMLPQALSNGICSLNPNEERLTITCMMEVNHKGEVVDYEIFPSVIKTSYRMTYTAVNAILAGEDWALKKYSQLVSICHDMHMASYYIHQRRETLGSINFDTKEAKILVNKKGKPYDIKVIERGRSEHIIEDFMIAANETVATHMKWLDIPSMYRVHEAPDPEKLRDFSKTARILGASFKGGVQDVHPKQLQQLLEAAKDNENYDILSTYLLRCMQKARYDAKCLGHFGLALEEYLHFTSPIRRYPDLLVHRMLHQYVFENHTTVDQVKKDEIFMEQSSEHVSRCERTAIDTERAVDDMKKAEYMENYVGQFFEGVVSSVTKFGIFVELDNTVEGLVHISNMKDDYYHYDENTPMWIGERTGKKYKMGQKVKVKVLDASKEKRQVDFAIAKENKRRTKNKK